MNLNLYKDYWLTSSVGDLCFTLKKKGIVKDKKSKSYGQETEATVNYPTSIESALDTICDREQFNSKASTWGEYLDEIHKLKNMVKALAKEIGADNLVKNIAHHSEVFLSQGDKPKETTIDDTKEEKPKRGRKKKE